MLLVAAGALLLFAAGAPLVSVAAEEPPVAAPAPAPSPPAAEDAPADDAPAKPSEDLFRVLLDGKVDGEWRGVLNRIHKERDAAWIDVHLGALFREPARFADRTELAAFTAAYLVDHPSEEGVVGLAPAILRRAWGDEAFLEMLRRHITVGEGGWARLLDQARAFLADEDAATRAVGAWFLSHEDGDQRERVRRELLVRAEEDLGRLEAGDDDARLLAGAYLDAFSRLLRYRFATPAEAVETLKRMQSFDLAALVGELSRLKDAPTAPLARKVLEYGKRLVDAAVATNKPEDLEEFLDPVRTPMTSVRRYAMLKAPSLAPTGSPVWARILERLLDTEDDAEVLGGALDLLERIGFADRPEHALCLSGALCRRLARGGPVSGSMRDRTPDRVRLAKAVGALRCRPDELEMLLAEAAALETPVLAELVRALGRVEGASVHEVLRYFRAGGDDSDRGREIRLAAVDALGRPGLRVDGEQPDPGVETGGQTLTAASALREMITGEGMAGLGRVGDPVVRRHAIRSLGNHPGKETATVLGAVALEGAEEEARVAIVVLRKTAVSDPHAVTALAEVAAAEAAASPLRVAALQALAGLGGAAEAEAVARARNVARAVLTSPADVEVRHEAARTAAALADPTALVPVGRFWAEAAEDADRQAAFAALLDAVAAAGDARDGDVANTLLALAADVPTPALEGLARSLLERHPRNAFRRVLAELILLRTQDAEDGEARAALEEADVLLQAILGPEPQDEVSGALGRRVEVKRRLGALTPEASARKAHWLEAVRLAARSTVPEVAAIGRDVADRLAAPPLKALLTAEETRRLAEDRAAIEKVLVGR